MREALRRHKSLQISCWKRPRAFKREIEWIFSFALLKKMINVPTWKLEGRIVFLLKITCLPHLGTFDLGKRQRVALREQLLSWTRLRCRWFPHVPRYGIWPQLAPRHNRAMRTRLCEIERNFCLWGVISAQREAIVKREAVFEPSRSSEAPFFGSQTCHSEKQTFTRCLR